MSVLWSPERYMKAEAHRLPSFFGIKRGTDIVKALCLGAQGVGIGRAALWGLAAGGPSGVERTLESEKALCKWFMRRLANHLGSEVLDEELKTAMRLLGAHNVGELGLHHVRFLILS